jgi:hypothetical protein
MIDLLINFRKFEIGELSNGWKNDL